MLVVDVGLQLEERSRAFDAAGEEISIDYKMSLGVLKSVGYEGAISIGFEGDGDLAEGTHKTRDLIEMLLVTDAR